MPPMPVPIDLPASVGDRREPITAGTTPVGNA
jgi:hypothetical protein